MINFEKLAIASVIEGKLKVTDLTVDMFTSRNPRFIYKLIKAYQEKYGSLPSIDVIQATINTQIDPEKAKVYCGYVEGLPEGVTESPDAILDGLKEDRGIKLLDSKIEELVGLVADRDLVKTRGLLKELLVSTSDASTSAIDAKDAEFSTDKLKMLDCFLADVDSKLQGVVLISGVSGGGKSLFALNQAMHSYRQGHDILYLNLELGQNEQLARMISHGAKIPFAEIYRDLDDRELEFFRKKKDDVFNRDNKFKLINKALSAETILSTIRSEAETGLDLVVLDYLQLTKNDTKGEKWQFIENFVQELHRLSLELGVVILTPIQVNTTDINEKNGNISVTPRGSRELEFSSSLFFHIHQSQDEVKNNLARLFTIKARQSAKKTYIMETQFSHMTLLPTGLVL